MLHVTFLLREKIFCNFLSRSYVANKKILSRVLRITPRGHLKGEDLGFPFRLLRNRSEKEKKGLKMSVCDSFRILIVIEFFCIGLKIIQTRLTEP